jgi:uncharacterized phiE125 gp8 family phage protein
MGVTFEGGCWSNWYPCWRDACSQQATTLHAVSVVNAPPTEEPLTLDEAKLRANLTWTAGDPRDALMTSFIRAARGKVESDTGVSLLLQTRIVYLDWMPNVLTLPAGSMPLQDIVGIDAINNLGQTMTINPATYIVDYASGRIALNTPTSSWPSNLRTFQPWAITLDAGWPDPETLATAAPLLLQAVGLLVAHYATLGRDLASINVATEIPQGYCDILAPYMPITVV